MTRYYYYESIFLPIIGERTNRGTSMDESWYWEMTFFIDLKHGKENTLYMESYIKKIIKTYVFENNFFAHYYFKKKKKKSLAKKYFNNSLGNKNIKICGIEKKKSSFPCDLKYNIFVIHLQYQQNLLHFLLWAIHSIIINYFVIVFFLKFIFLYVKPLKTIHSFVILIMD